MRYKGKGNIKKNIIDVSHHAFKLKVLKLDLFEDILMHLVLISLSTQFSQFKESYNCQKETQSLNEFISHYVQEEERLKQENTESAYLTSTFKNKDEENKRIKNQNKEKECAIEIDKIKYINDNNSRTKIENFEKNVKTALI